MGGGRPRVIIATILRERGPTGIQTHIRALRRHLEARGDPVAVCTPFDTGRLLTAPVFAARAVLERVHGALGVWSYRHWHGRVLRRVLARELGARARTSTPAVVYAQCPDSARAALEARASPAQRVVLAVHWNVSQADEWIGKGRIRRGGRLHRAIASAERDAVARVDGLVCFSRFMERAVRRHDSAGRPLPPLIVCPGFVEAPADPGATATAGDLISIGSLEPRKNQRYLLHVLAEARRRGRRYSLTLVGDGPERGALGALAARLGLDGQVRFLGVRPQAARLIGGHRGYVHAALVESFGLTLVEAMARGVPVVAAPVGGIPEVLTDGVDGLFWPLDDPGAAAARLVALLDDEPRRAALGRAARARFAAAFAAEVAAPPLAAFLATGARAGVRRAASSGRGPAWAPPTGHAG